MKRILLIAGLMMLWVTAHSQIAYYKTGWKLADQEKVHVYSTNNGSVEFEIADGGEYRIRGYNIDPKTDSLVLTFTIHCVFISYDEQMGGYVYKATVFDFLSLKYTKSFLFSKKKLSEFQSGLTLNDGILISAFREGSDGKWYPQRRFVLTFHKRLPK